jgi:murein DD-endopeptidase MepM/ murein hydrolase activator NlpD
LGIKVTIIKNFKQLFIFNKINLTRTVMKKYCFTSLISAVVFFIYSSACAFNAAVTPSEINPGDAFVIKIDDVEIPHLPAASLKGRKFYFSRCGGNCSVAIGTIGIRTKPGVYTIKLKVGGKTKNLHLTVKQYIFPTIKLTLPDNQVFLSKKDLKRVESENKRLKQIFQKVSQSYWEGNFTLPLENDISTPFGIKRILNKKWVSIHRGIDITGQDGEEVKASNNGRVVLADELFFGGNTVILDHGIGIYTIYMHLSRFNINVGDMVSKNDVIGFVGSSGRSTGPHLHFGVKVMNMSTNPVSLIELNL